MFEGFALSAKALVKSPDLRIATRGGVGGHVKRGFDLGASAADGKLFVRTRKALYAFGLARP
jgi:hypothetical protein